MDDTLYDMNRLLLSGVISVSVLEPPHTCDRSSFRSHITPEGAIGQTALFPWFGLLKVYLHDIDSVTVAVTGIVLIKDHYAIASADDVAKIPEKVFMERSEAMFVPKNDKEQYYSLRGYVTHPEYPAVSTIALIDLHPGDSKPFPILPVCQPRSQFNSLSELYTLGFTDNNGPLEKFLYKMEFVDPKICKHYYELAGLTYDNLNPQNSECASAKNLKQACVWDTGTALVSNVTGNWALVGFGIRGPGCAAPARSIVLTTYWPWILSHTGLTREQEHYIFKQGFKEHRRRYGGPVYYNDLTESRYDPLMHAKPISGFDAPAPEMKYVPLHAILRQPPPEAQPQAPPEAPANTPLPVDIQQYEYISQYYQKWMEDDMFLIDRINETEIHIRPATGTGWGRWGNCTDPSLKLVYKDYINVTTQRSNPGNVASIQYKISLFDLWYSNYTCVIIKVKTLRAVHAYLQYTIGMYDGGDIFPWTPEEILKYNTLVDPLAETKNPNAKMNKYVITNPINDDSVRSMMLYLKVLFAKESRLEIRVYGPPIERATEESETTPPTFIYNPIDTK